MALEEACETVEENATRVRSLRDCLEEQLGQIEGAYVVGKAAPRVPGISNVCFEGLDHQALIPLLDARGVCASAGSACSAGAVKTSHVLRAMGVSESLVKGAVRFSFSVDTTQEDGDAGPLQCTKSPCRSSGKISAPAVSRKRRNGTDEEG